MSNARNYVHERAECLGLIKEITDMIRRDRKKKIIAVNDIDVARMRAVNSYLKDAKRISRSITVR